MTDLLWRFGELPFMFIVVPAALLVLWLLALAVGRLVRSPQAAAATALGLGAIFGIWLRAFLDRMRGLQWEDVTAGRDTSVLLGDDGGEADAEFDEWRAQIIALPPDAYLCRECAHAAGLRPAAEPLPPSRPWWCEGCERDTACHRRADFNK